MFGRMYTDESNKAAKERQEGQGQKGKLPKPRPDDEQVTRTTAPRLSAGTPYIEAAVHVAHSFTTHRSSPEDDYFSATDDLSRREESGASHIDTQFFGSGVFYTYVVINRDQLVKNLGGNVELADRCIEALVRVLPSTSPNGKRASFGSHGKSQFAFVEIGSQQPRSLAAAFCEPVRSLMVAASTC